MIVVAIYLKLLFVNVILKILHEWENEPSLYKGVNLVHWFPRNHSAKFRDQEMNVLHNISETAKFLNERKA